MLWACCRCMVLSISLGELHSLLSRTHKHSICLSQLCCRYFDLTASLVLVLNLLVLTRTYWVLVSWSRQLFDRSGMLYGELARFVLRMLGIRTKSKKGKVQGPDTPAFEGPAQQFIEAPKGNNSWDNVWGNWDAFYIMQNLSWTYSLQRNYHGMRGCMSAVNRNEEYCC